MVFKVLFSYFLRSSWHTFNRHFIALFGVDMVRALTACHAIPGVGEGIVLAGAVRRNRMLMEHERLEREAYLIARLLQMKGFGFCSSCPSLS